MPPRTDSHRTNPLSVLALLEDARDGLSSTQISDATGASWSAVKRQLAALVSDGLITAEGRARATRYRLARAAAGSPARRVAEPEAPYPADDGDAPRWSHRSRKLRAALSTAPTSRRPVSYKRAFADDYEPNRSSLLPHDLADELMAIGRVPEQLPAGTYARKVLEQLLIDLSWSSSRLEGNHYSLLDTQELFRSGRAATDLDGVMLLNHKAAIEFLVDAVPTQGLSAGLLQNMHALLMRDLLPDPRSLGAVRSKVVNISGTAYVPSQMPQLLREMFELVVKKARQVRNPVEAAFFLWVNLAYLQPFEDGNKRVSRLAANIPLMLYNQAPLSFLDVHREDYALAMMGVYEFRDVSMAADLFEWTFRRSQAKYRVVLEAMGAPDPFRLAHREALSEAVLLVVRARKSAAQALRGIGVSRADSAPFRDMLVEELDALEDYNCARYRLLPRETAAWIRAGRPR